MYNHMLDKCIWKELKGIEGFEIAYHALINITKYYSTRDSKFDIIYSFGGKDSNSQAVSKLYKLTYHDCINNF